MWESVLLGQLAWRENKKIFRFDQVECLISERTSQVGSHGLVYGQDSGFNLMSSFELQSLL